MYTTVKDRQSLFDIALITAGSIAAAFDLAADNGLSVTDELKPNMELTMPSVIISEVANHYRINNLSPATALDLADDYPEGIEYWRVHYDFAVS